MNNRLNMLFNQELDNEAQYINSHPFSSINMSLVRCVAGFCVSDCEIELSIVRVEKYAILHRFGLGMHLASRFIYCDTAAVSQLN